MVHVPLNRSASSHWPTPAGNARVQYRDRPSTRPAIKASHSRTEVLLLPAFGAAPRSVGAAAYATDSLPVCQRTRSKTPRARWWIALRVTPPYDLSPGKVAVAGQRSHFCQDCGKLQRTIIRDRANGMGHAVPRVIRPRGLLRVRVTKVLSRGVAIP